MVRETRYLRVGDLPKEVNDEVLSHQFQRFGKIQNVRIDRSKEPFSAVIAFLDIKAATKAHCEVHDINGKAVVVGFCDASGNLLGKSLTSRICTSSPLGGLNFKESAGVGCAKQASDATGERKADVNTGNASGLERRHDDRSVSGQTSLHSNGEVKSPTRSSQSQSLSRSTSPSSTNSKSDFCSNNPKAKGVLKTTTRQSEVEVEDSRPNLGIRITRLPMRSTDSSLRDGLFHEYKKHGKVTHVVVSGQGDGRQAIVSFKKPEDAAKALEASQEKLFFGAKIKVALDKGIEYNGDESEEESNEVSEYNQKATRTLFVGNLEKDVTVLQLGDIFKSFGNILDIDIKKQGAVSAYAFVQYTDIASVVRAMRQMDGHHIGSNKIKLGFGKSMPTNCVWLEGVAEAASEKFLHKQFGRYGLVIHVLVDRRRARALIYYDAVDEAHSAVQEMKSRPLAGKRVQVDFASRDCQTEFKEMLEKCCKAPFRGDTEIPSKTWMPEAFEERSLHLDLLGAPPLPLRAIVTRDSLSDCSDVRDRKASLDVKMERFDDYQGKRWLHDDQESRKNARERTRVTDEQSKDSWCQVYTRLGDEKHEDKRKRCTRDAWKQKSSSPSSCGGSAGRYISSSSITSKESRSPSPLTVSSHNKKIRCKVGSSRPASCSPLQRPSRSQSKTPPLLISSASVTTLESSARSRSGTPPTPTKDERLPDPDLLCLDANEKVRSNVIDGSSSAGGLPIADPRHCRSHRGISGHERLPAQSASVEKNKLSSSVSFNTTNECILESGTVKMGNCSLPQRSSAARRTIACSSTLRHPDCIIKMSTGSSGDRCEDTAFDVESAESSNSDSGGGQSHKELMFLHEKKQRLLSMIEQLDEAGSPEGAGGGEDVNGEDAGISTTAAIDADMSAVGKTIERDSPLQTEDRPRIEALQECSLSTLKRHGNSVSRGISVLTADNGSSCSEQSDGSFYTSSSINIASAKLTQEPTLFDANKTHDRQGHLCHISKESYDITGERVNEDCRQHSLPTSVSQLMLGLPKQKKRKDRAALETPLIKTGTSQAVGVSDDLSHSVASSDEESSGVDVKEKRLRRTDSISSLAPTVPSLQTVPVDIPIQDPKPGNPFFSLSAVAELHELLMAKGRQRLVPRDLPLPKFAYSLVQSPQSPVRTKMVSPRLSPSPGLQVPPKSPPPTCASWNQASRSADGHQAINVPSVLSKLLLSADKKMTLPSTTNKGVAECMLPEDDVKPASVLCETVSYTVIKCVKDMEPPIESDIAGSSSLASRDEHEIEARIRALDEKLRQVVQQQQQQADAIPKQLPPPVDIYSKYRIRKKSDLSGIGALLTTAVPTVNNGQLAGSGPSVIGQTLLTRTSIFDQDSLRLENIDEKYEPKAAMTAGSAIVEVGIQQPVRVFKTKAAAKELPASPILPSETALDSSTEVSSGDIHEKQLHCSIDSLRVYPSSVLVANGEASLTVPLSRAVEFQLQVGMSPGEVSIIGLTDECQPVLSPAKHGHCGMAPAADVSSTFPLAPVKSTSYELAKTKLDVEKSTAHTPSDEGATLHPYIEVPFEASCSWPLKTKLQGISKTSTPNPVHNTPQTTCLNPASMNDPVNASAAASELLFAVSPKTEEAKTGVCSSVPPKSFISTAAVERVELSKPVGSLHKLGCLESGLNNQTISDNHSKAKKDEKKIASGSLTLQLPVKEINLFSAGNKGDHSEVFNRVHAAKRDGKASEHEDDLLKKAIAAKVHEKKASASKDRKTQDAALAQKVSFVEEFKRKSTKYSSDVQLIIPPENKVNLKHSSATEQHNRTEINRIKEGPSKKEKVVASSDWTKNDKQLPAYVSKTNDRKLTMVGNIAVASPKKRKSNSSALQEKGSIPLSALKKGAEHRQSWERSHGSHDNMHKEADALLSSKIGATTKKKVLEKLVDREGSKTMRKPAEAVRVHSKKNLTESLHVHGEPACSLTKLAAPASSISVSNKKLQNTVSVNAGVRAAVCSKKCPEKSAATNKNRGNKKRRHVSTDGEEEGQKGLSSAEECESDDRQSTSQGQSHKPTAEKTEQQKKNWMDEYAPFLVYDSMYDKVKLRSSKSAQAKQRDVVAKPTTIDGGASEDCPTELAASLDVSNNSVSKARRPNFSGTHQVPRLQLDESENRLTEISDSNNSDSSMSAVPPKKMKMRRLKELHVDASAKRKRPRLTISSSEEGDDHAASELPKKHVRTPQKRQLGSKAHDYLPSKSKKSRRTAHAVEAAAAYDTSGDAKSESSSSSDESDGKASSLQKKKALVKMARLRSNEQADGEETGGTGFDKDSSRLSAPAKHKAGSPSLSGAMSSLESLVSSESDDDVGKLQKPRAVQQAARIASSASPKKHSGMCNTKNSLGGNRRGVTAKRKISTTSPASSMSSCDSGSSGCDSGTSSTEDAKSFPKDDGGSTEEEEVTQSASVLLSSKAKQLNVPGPKEQGVNMHNLQSGSLAQEASPAISAGKSVTMGNTQLANKDGGSSRKSIKKRPEASSITTQENLTANKKKEASCALSTLTPSPSTAASGGESLLSSSAIDCHYDGASVKVHGRASTFPQTSVQIPKKDKNLNLEEADVHNRAENDFNDGQNKPTQTETSQLRQKTTAVTGILHVKTEIQADSTAGTFEEKSEMMDKLPSYASVIPCASAVLTAQLEVQNVPRAAAAIQLTDVTVPARDSVVISTHGNSPCITSSSVISLPASDAESVESSAIEVDGSSEPLHNQSEDDLAEIAAAAASVQGLFDSNACEAVAPVAACEVASSSTGSSELLLHDPAIVEQITQPLVAVADATVLPSHQVHGKLSKLPSATCASENVDCGNIPAANLRCTSDAESAVVTAAITAAANTVDSATLGSSSSSCDEMQLPVETAGECRLMPTPSAECPPLEGSHVFLVPATPPPPQPLQTTAPIASRGLAVPARTASSLPQRKPLVAVPTSVTPEHTSYTEKLASTAANNVIESTLSPFMSHRSSSTEVILPHCRSSLAPPSVAVVSPRTSQTINEQVDAHFEKAMRASKDRHPGFMDSGKVEGETRMFDSVMSASGSSATCLFPLTHMKTQRSDSSCLSPHLPAGAAMPCRSQQMGLPLPISQAYAGSTAAIMAVAAGVGSHPLQPDLSSLAPFISGTSSPGVVEHAFRQQSLHGIMGAGCEGGRSMVGLMQSQPYFISPATSSLSHYGASGLVHHPSAAEQRTMYPPLNYSGHHLPQLQGSSIMTAMMNTHAAAASLQQRTMAGDARLVHLAASGGSGSAIHHIIDAPHSPQYVMQKQRERLLMALQHYHIAWKGTLALKSDTTSVEMLYVCGSHVLPAEALPLPESGLCLLRVAQRMRLEQQQLDDVSRKMKHASDFTLLLVVPSGDMPYDPIQTETMQLGFIEYLQEKQAAGIINVAMPGSRTPAYVVHIFPPCDFSHEKLASSAPELHAVVRDFAHLLVIITTVT